MAEKVIIIGAGISGLSAGAYLQMNGFDTEIFESHTIPGGLCTSWERKGYMIDGCIHWLVGSKPGIGLYDAWNELVDMKALTIYDHEVFYRFEDENGNFINFYNDIDLLEQELLTKAPEDQELISDYVHAARKFLRMELPLQKPRELYTVTDGLKAMWSIGPYLPLLAKWSKVSIEDFALRAKNSLLRKTLHNLFVPEMSIVFVMITTAWMHKKIAGYPVGGSLSFSQQIEKRYLNLGGKIHYGKSVVEILTGNNVNGTTVKGIKTANGEEHAGTMVISAADGHFTLNTLLKGRFTDEKNRRFYKESLVFPSYLQFSAGISKVLNTEASSLIFPLETPIYIDPGNTISDIGIRVHSFDPTLSPAGKSLITAMIPSRNEEYWSDMRMNDFKKYRQEKERIINQIITGVSKRLMISDLDFEMTDLSTPATVVRYTNNWQGSFEGWILRPGMSFNPLPSQLPGLQNFYMTGHWTSPGGGLPAALMTGRGVAQIICKRQKKEFRTMSF